MSEIKNLNYCSKCVMPGTTEGANFDEQGQCMACQAQNIKQTIDWDSRKKELEKILVDAKAKAGDNYDCIIPISGGKDSIYQLHVIVKEYGLKPLCVTFNHSGFTKTGMYNLWNCLDQFGVDHIQFTLNNNVVKKIQRRSVETIGDFCWHCHAMVSSFTIQTAVNYKIPLIIWGESGAEYGHQGATYNNMVKFDQDYFTKLSSKLTPEEFACEYLSMKDLYPAKLPSIEECKDLIGIHLGNYIPWDTEKQVELVKSVYNWKGREVGGSYKDYKSIECSFEPMHEIMCLFKRGFARTSLQASQEVRDGILTREQAFELIEKFERVEPKHFSYYLVRIGLTRDEFFNKLESLKADQMKGVCIDLIKEWRKCEEDGKPFIERFLEDMHK